MPAATRCASSSCPTAHASRWTRSPPSRWTMRRASASCACWRAARCSRPPCRAGGPAFTVTTPDASATALGTRYTVERQGMAPASRSMNTACKCIAGSAPTIAPTSWTAATASRSRPTASSASPRQASGAGLEPRPARSTMWRCRRGGAVATPASACWCWGSRAQCAHLRHRAPGRPETRAGTAARADPRADHRPAGTAAAALTATTGMRRPICRLPIGK